MKILVTGASGFVGRALSRELVKCGHVVRGAVRTDDAGRDLPCDSLSIGAIHGRTDWRAALKGMDVVVHLAARTHVMSDEAADPLAAYRQMNVDATMRLAHQASVAGVQRLLYLSSVKVNGERTTSHPFREYDPPAPEDAYGLSKLEAEIRLTEWCTSSGPQLVILRSPLVYGAGVKGNLLQLMRAIDKGFFLPFAAIRNRRSLLAVHNLTSAIECCARHPNAASSTFLVADDLPLSTPDLARAIAAHMKRPARLVSVPVPVLRFAGRVLNRSAPVDRLVSSLVVDNRKIASDLGWRPASSFEEDIADMVRAYFETR